jgi:hypothetical protein
MADQIGAQFALSTATNNYNSSMATRNGDNVTVQNITNFYTQTLQQAQDAGNQAALDLLTQANTKIQAAATPYGTAFSGLNTAGTTVQAANAAFNLSQWDGCVNLCTQIGTILQNAMYNETNAMTAYNAANSLVYQAQQLLN